MFASIDRRNRGFFLSFCPDIFDPVVSQGTSDAAKICRCAFIPIPWTSVSAGAAVETGVSKFGCSLDDANDEEIFACFTVCFEIFSVTKT